MPTTKDLDRNQGCSTLSRVENRTSCDQTLAHLYVSRKKILGFSIKASATFKTPMEQLTRMIKRKQTNTCKEVIYPQSLGLSRGLITRR